MKMRKSTIVCLTAVVCCLSSMLYAYRTDRQNALLMQAVQINKVEREYFVDTINEMNRLPTYEQGCKDTLVKMGGPTQPGAYRDGWDAAMSLNGEGWAGGYHAAIQQFGYQKPDTSRYLAELRELEDKSELAKAK